MIEGLKPYAEYKESGQEWLGRVPGHGDVRRTKLILREVDSRSTTGKEQLLRVSQYRTRLTADLVTGKLDVRETAAHLPAPPAVPTAEPLADELLEEIESADVRVEEE